MGLPKHDVPVVGGWMVWLYMYNVQDKKKL